MTHPSKRLILFTRYPVAGRTKTRLIPVLGSEGAASLHRRLTLRAVRLGEQAHRLRAVEFQIHFDGADVSAMQSWLGDRFTFRQQAEGDLGQRMAGAFEESFRCGAQATVLIGADCPELTPSLIAEAFDALHHAPVVFGPALDGGYYLVGLSRPIPDLFHGLVWGGSEVLADSLNILKRAGLGSVLLRSLADIDRPEDLAAWHQLVVAEERDLSKISVIIPALNEADQIARTIKSAAGGNPTQILVVDGGSCDETIQRAQEAGAMVLRSGPGRGRQMNAGASSSTGNALLFLHGDTVLPPDYAPALAACLADTNVSGGAFRFSIRDQFFGRSLIQWTTNLRSLYMQMPYGDQGLFLRRALFEEAGGFADLPILEDYEFVRRLRGIGRVKTLSQRAATSGRRWQRLGVVRTTWINKRVITGYRRGVPIEKLAAMYRAHKRAT